MENPARTAEWAAAQPEERGERFAAVTPGAPSPAAEEAPLVELKHIHVAFGQLVALEDVSFSLWPGQLLGLIGPNGAGKTTLLRVLAGLQAAQYGEVRVGGRSLPRESDEIRRHIGFAPDSPPVYEDLTLEQFLRFIGRCYELESEDIEERVSFWLDRLWLTDKRSIAIRNLSRGMRQRVTLARTFLPRPRVLLLDEPLIGIDPKGRVQLRAVLGMLREQTCAMIVSSHILSDLEEVATHIGIIEKGRLLRFEANHGAGHSIGPRQRYRMRAAGTRDASRLEALQRLEGLLNVAELDGAYYFDVEGDDAELARQVKRIVEAGVPLTGLEPVRESLEERYMKIGVRQVD